VSKNLTKYDISKILSRKTGFSILLSKKLINNLIDTIILNIKNDNFNFKNLGRFKLLNKNKRIGRNPKTMKEFIIEPRKSISFKPSSKLLEILN
jgi:nucleoid DNA-binding protein